MALSHGGDYVMYGDQWELWSQWLGHNELCTTETGRVLPILPTRGNHDFGTLFDEVFDDPGGRGLNYYRSRLSSDVSLVTLNSQISVAGDQLTWLESELEAANHDSRWLLTNYHRPLYPAVKAPGPAKPFWAPLFDRYGVDIALESDGHCIKRTEPIRADALDPAGVIYVGEGGLGVPQRTPRRNLWYLQAPAVVTNGHHVLRLDFSSEALSLEILRLGEVLDPLDPRLYRAIVPPGATWSYIAQEQVPEGWTELGFDALAWDRGPAGFGFGDDDDATTLDSMQGVSSHLFTRFEFDSELCAQTESLSLMARYDDAFVAYLNGTEVARGGIAEGDWTSGEPKVELKEALHFESFEVRDWRQLVHPGTNVLALVGINRRARDSDFSLDAWLAGDRSLAPGTPQPWLEPIDVRLLSPRER
ncbi:metallophosphoesterase family protein [Engelhardtia mirabilis]|uniref:Calcineurin-like phosphoesterase domain-containing protein n=1 Tax=Engelhardtia mirabilis TaxID=2528011 RepID=A0A518BKG6_9BACT|nr:hypothetical protein Pla133_25570 [Planctomycetes bacterium Pla133]QDV01800.1 hypothetical protein Pla86_25560 [Planctomycetes bacterium Pla86]